MSVRCLAMPKALQPRRGPSRSVAASKRVLARSLVDEIRATTRPGAQKDAIARLERAVELLDRGDPRGAGREAEKAKVLSPRSAGVREVLGIALYGQERWREALAELKTYKRLSGRADQNHLMADCLRALGKPGDAVPLAEEALRSDAPIEPKVEAVIVAAAALRDLGRYGEALAMLRRAQTRENVSAGPTLRLWYLEADVMERAGRKDEAERVFRKILRHDPAAFDVAERLAQLSG